MIESALLNWTLNQVLTTLVIITRVGPLLFLMPIIGSTAVPMQIKALFTLMTALVLLPVVAVGATDLPVSPLGFGIFIASEVAFGGILAILARFIFAAVQLAGQMVGIQMGMGMAGVMDPQFGVQVSPIGQFWSLTATLLFLAINGHHIFFSTLVESFQWVRPGTMRLSQATYDGIMQGMAHMFILAIKIMAPAAVALFFAHVGMGIIAKTVPQIPILIVGMPMNIGIGLLFVGLSLGYFVPLMISSFETLGRLLPRLAQGMGI
jgi:flagellar biosynthetic protein FliR